MDGQFAGWIRRRRQELALTQEELAERAGLSPRTVRNLESGRGVKPAPHTRRAVLAVLGPLESAPQPTPAQLPADIAVFVGRDNELHKLRSRIDQPGTAPLIMLVSGPAGVGKTALAVRLAHQVQDRFTGGQIYVDLRGYDPDRPMKPEDALVGLLEALGVAPAAIPLDPGHRAAAYRSTVAGRRLLIVLDNAASPDQIRMLLPGSPSCATLITSRDPLSGLVAREGAIRLRLTPLASASSAALLTTLIGTRSASDPDATAALAERCVGLPLALRVAAELVNTRPAAPLTTVLDDLNDERRRLDLFSDPADTRTAVRDVFSWSLRHVRPADQQMFALLGRLPCTRFEPYAVGALAGVPPEAARTSLSALASNGLLVATGITSWTFHDLLRAYARELPVPTGRRAAVTRLIDHYLATAAAASDLCYPADSVLRQAPPHSEAERPPFADAQQALAWLTDTHEALLSVAASAVTQDRPRPVIAFSELLFRHFDSAGFYVDAVHLHGLARDAARELGDRTAESRALVGLGAAHFRQGGYGPVSTYLEEALALGRAVGDGVLAGRALNLIGAIAFQQGEPEKAVAALEDTARLFREGDYRFGEATVLTNLGIAHWRRNDFPLSADCHRRAITLFAALGHESGVAMAKVNLGSAYWRLGEYVAAKTELTDARLITQRSGDRNGEGHALMNLAISERRLGELAAADEHVAAASAIFEAVRDRAAEAELVNELGALRLAQHRIEDAIAGHRRALELFREIGDTAGEAAAANGLGVALRTAGDLDAAEAGHREALVSASRIPERFEQARAYTGLADILDLRGRDAEARRLLKRAEAALAGIVAPELAEIRRRLTRSRSGDQESTAISSDG